MYVYIYIYIHTLYLYLYVCLSLSLYIYIYTCVYLSVSLSLSIYIYIYVIDNTIFGGAPTSSSPCDRILSGGTQSSRGPTTSSLQSGFGWIWEAGLRQSGNFEMTVEINRWHDQRVFHVALKLCQGIAEE